MRRLFSTAALIIVWSIGLGAQNRPVVASTLTTTSTGAASVCVGCAIGGTAATGNTRTGTLIVAGTSGGASLIGATSGSGGSAQFEIISASDPLMSLYMSGAGSTAREAAWIAYGLSSTGAITKLGVTAVAWTDTTNATGYASWNEHASFQNAGVQTDEFGWVHWGNRGAAIFPSSIAAANAPGPRIVHLYSSIAGQTGFITQNTSASVDASTAYLVQNSNGVVGRWKGFGASFATSGMSQADGALVEAARADLSLAASNASTNVRFYAGDTTTLRANISSTLISLNLPTTLTSTANAFTGYTANNANAGNAAFTGLIAQNGNGSVGRIIIFGASYTTAGMYEADGVTVESTREALSLGATNTAKTIRFYAGNSTNIRASITTSGIALGSTLAFGVTAPTVASGFGTSPSIPASNGTAAFTVDVGTGGIATGGVLTMPTAATGWNCVVTNQTAVAANRADQRTVQTASSTTSVTVQNQTISTGAALAWTASDVLTLACIAR